MQGAADVSNRSHVRTGLWVERAAGGGGGGYLPQAGIGRKIRLGLGRAAPCPTLCSGHGRRLFPVHDYFIFFLMLQTLLQRKAEKGQLGVGETQKSSSVTELKS